MTHKAPPCACGVYGGHLHHWCPFRPHIPYRDHKLTKILADCIGGSANTVFITTIGPSDWDYNETLSTLSFASRCMNIRAAPIQNRIDASSDQSELVQKLKVREGSCTRVRRVANGVWCIAWSIIYQRV